MSFKPKIVPLGDSSLLIELGTEIDLTINQRVHALAALIDADALPGVIEMVPAYATLLVHYDPLELSFAHVKSHLRERIFRVEETAARRPRLLEVPTRYGGAFGLDLESVAEHCRLSIRDVIHIHSSKTYTVYMLGFAPGFAYMGKLDDAIVMPRLHAPRTHVAAGTVAMAGAQTGIFPHDSPSGWQLIGHTALQLIDLESATPFLFAPGDQVRFIVEE